MDVSVNLTIFISLNASLEKISKTYFRLSYSLSPVSYLL